MVGIYKKIGFGLLFIAVNFSSNLSAKAPSSLENDKANSIFELDLVELGKIKVVVASKKKENIDDSPGIISVITSKDIEKYGAKDLNDLLSRLPNVYKFGSGALRDNVTSIRGQTVTHIDNHVLILINGRPTRESHSGGINLAIYQAFPLESIQRIEVIRGPGSVLYGSNAFSGVINIVTKDPNEFRENEITAGYGSDNTGFTSVLLNKQSGDFGLLVSGKFLDSEGWRFHATDGTGVTDSVDYSQKNWGVFSQAKYKKLTFTGFASSQNDTTLGIPPEWPASDLEKTHRYFFDTQFEHHHKQGWQSNVNLTFSASHYHDALSQNNKYYDFLIEPSTKGLVFEDVYLVAGGTYQHIKGELTNGQVDYSTDRFSFYTQIDYSPSKSLKLIAGIQLNKPQGIDLNASPRFGGILHITPKLGIKLLFGKAFRSAFAAEQALDAAFLKGNPNLGPETIQTWDLQLFYETSSVRTALTYYISQQEDTVIRETRPDGVRTFANGGNIDYEGIELEGSANLSSGLELTGSVSYQRNEDDAGNSDVGFIPNFMAKAGVFYRWEKGVSLGLFNTYSDDAAKLEGAPQLNPPAENYSWLTLKGALELRRFLNRSDVPDITFNLYGENLLDADVYFPEVNFKSVNTLPSRSGVTVYGSVSLRI